MKTFEKLESLYFLLLYQLKTILRFSVEPLQVNAYDLAAHLIQQLHTLPSLFVYKYSYIHIFLLILLIHDNGILAQKLYGIGNTIIHVITFEICSFVFSWLNCGNNLTKYDIWADFYAKLFLSTSKGRGYLSFNIRVRDNNEYYSCTLFFSDLSWFSSLQISSFLFYMLY